APAPRADGRLYGRVTTLRGQTYEGFLRWDRNEGSWADLLDATKAGERRAASVSVRIVSPDPEVRVRGRTVVVTGGEDGERTITLVGGEDGDAAGLRVEEVRVHPDPALVPAEQVRLRAEQARAHAEAVRAQVEEALARSGRSRVGREEARLDRAEARLDGVRARLDEMRVAVSGIGNAFAFSTSGGIGSQSGIRFGHVQKLVVLDDNRARLTLRSGEQVEFIGRGTDLGTALRALVVETPEGGQFTLDWDDLDMVEFMEAPEDARPREARLWGTLETRSGDAFTGWVTWDVDEIFSNDVLDGEQDGVEHEIPFGRIASIERAGSRASHVTLRDGTTLRLEGSNDVDASNRGISISDPALGQVLVQWDEFASVRFHEPDEGGDHAVFDGGRPLRGTVETKGGEHFEGRLVWDQDEAYTWEMLNGSAHDVEFSIELGNVARIVCSGHGAEVTLRDGRTFHLEGSNDVDSGNRGVLVEAEDGTRTLVPWSRLHEVRFEG
ncbi:MAG: hypothetical protein D6701_13165, partial [Gemmatimonadetes bacterium]